LAQRGQTLVVDAVVVRAAERSEVAAASLGTELPTGLELEAVTAGVSADTTRRRLNAGVVGLAEGERLEAAGNQASLSHAVVLRAIEGDLVALFGLVAEVPSGEGGHTVAAVVVGSAAGRNSHTAFSLQAERLSLGADGVDTLAGNAVVVRATFRLDVALLGGVAEAEAGLEGLADTTLVPNGAAGGDVLAEVVLGAEDLVGAADGDDANGGLAVINQAVGRLDVALLGLGAEGPAFFDTDAVAAVVVGVATGGDGHALAALLAVGASGGADGSDASLSLAVVDIAVGRLLVALQGLAALEPAAHERQALAAVVVGGAAGGSGDAGVGSGAEGGTSLAKRNQANAVGAVVDVAVSGFLEALVGGGAQTPASLEGLTLAAVVSLLAAGRGLGASVG